MISVNPTGMFPAVRCNIENELIGRQFEGYILCRFADRSAIYNTWMDDCPIPCVVVDDCAPQWQVPSDAGIVITHMHYRWEEIHALRKMFQKSSVPVLILADGILEYRIHGAPRAG